MRLRDLRRSFWFQVTCATAAYILIRAPVALSAPYQWWHAVLDLTAIALLVWTAKENL